MTNEFSDFEEVPFDPASMATSSLGLAKAVLYKRPWFLITVAVVVVLALSVLSDLPQHITKKEDAASQNATLKQINGDIQPCAFAVSESFNFYNRLVAGTLKSSELSQIPPLLIGDQTACSFASQPIYDLTNNIQPRETAAGKDVDKVLRVAQQWMTNSALAAIEDIQYLFKNSGASLKIADLTKQEAKLAQTRQRALSDVHAAETDLGITLVHLKIPVLPHLRGT
ncbi:MAG TPA: hypothetical protein VGZ68_01795 [Acidimicrobiales bacterium]|nr:hypothetical protein [Acidimicrobiales bacterium]